MAERGDKKQSSTARRIRRGAARQLLAVTLWVDLIALCLAVFAWCNPKDCSYAGTPNSLFPAVQRQLLETKAGDGAHYTYEIRQEGRDPASFDATEPLRMLVRCTLLALPLEAVLLLLANAVGALRIQRQLRPLNRLAEAAQSLGRRSFAPPAPPPAPKADATAVPEEKVHSLESAIGRISPTAPEAKLKTGDASLAGLEDAINDLLVRMRESYQQQTRFVSDASHELRTPIAVIKGYADMLARWGRSDAAVLDEGITAIQSETEHMNRLVEQLLFLARGDSGRTQLAFTEVSLTNLVREVYEESVMIHPEHRWKLSADGEIPVRADAAMLKQATRILVDNAVKYTPAGETIRLRAFVNAQGAPAIEVQDSGVGIAGEDVPHVFERFFRADPARSGQTGGTGLGLAIAKWIVDRHGGYFEVVSRKDVGTRITICLTNEAPAP